VSPKWSGLRAHTSDLGCRGDSLDTQRATRPSCNSVPLPVGSGANTSSLDLIDERAMAAAKQQPLALNRVMTSAMVALACSLISVQQRRNGTAPERCLKKFAQARSR
jgi:hypothetical protein